MRNQWYLIIWLLLPLGLSGQIDYNIQLKSGTIRQTEMLAPESVSESFIQHNRLGNFFYLVLQFNELPDEVMMQELNSLGIQLVGYLPHYAYLAKIPADTDFSALNVRRVIPFLPQHKLSEALAVGDYSDVKREGDIYYIKVVPFDDFTDFELADMLNNYGLGHATHSEAGVVVKIYRDQILRLAKHPAIQYVEGYSDQVLTEGLEGVGMQRLNFLHQGPGRGLDGTGVSVAIADDGTVSHPDLKGRLTTYTSNNLGDHGDMTVGLFAGAGNINPNGIGAAPGVNMHLYSINGYPHINNARDNYQKNRVTITSTSYGEVCGGIYNSTTSDIDGQVFGFPALLHVFSAGNSGRSSCANPYGAQSYNGSYFGNITGGMKAGKNVIAVGNVYFNDVLASSSSHGPTVDGRIKPDIVANGQGNFTIDGGTGYRSGGGTSAASPSLGGVAAGLYQAYRSLNGNEDPNSGLIKAILLNTAEDLGRPGPDYEFGWGRVHAGRALETIQSRQFLSGSVRNGNVATHTLQIPANVRRAKIMVYWVDPAAAPNAARALVNDLDMTVTLPTGGVSRPLVLSTVARLDSLLKPAYPGVDRVNNVEQVVLNQPGAGTYTVSVRGSAVAQGPQTYFVVYHYETQNLSLTYPRGGESLVAGEKTTLYWDAIGNTGSFTLEYATSTNGNWQMIAANIPVGQRYFEWNVPEGLSGNYFFRIRRNQEVSVSATAAHILKTPNFSITYGPNNQAVISWSAVNGADGYEVFALGNKYMEPIGQTSQTQFSFPATPWQGNWYSVRARHSSGVEGQRAHAKYYLHRPCEAEVQLTIQLDQYPDETSWQVRTPSGEVLLSGGPYPSSDRNKLLVIRECLPATCLEFVIRDSYGDGICCTYINGYYELKNSRGEVLASGGNFGSVETKPFCLTNTPTPLAIEVVSTKDVSCNGGSDGEARVAASGGSGAYTYRWPNGQTGAQVSGLRAGTYRVTATDGSTQAITSAVVAEPTAIAVSFTKTDPGCSGENTGSIAAAVSGGTGPYSFVWSNGVRQAAIANLTPGSYSVTVSDQKSCVQTATTSIVSGQMPDFSIVQKNISCFGGNDGELSVSGQSLSGSFSYRWSTGATGASVRNLAAGAYSVTVSHSSGCETVRQVQLAQPEELRVTLQGGDVLCVGTATGSVASTVSGGRSPYRYLWSNGSQGTTLSNVSAGTYSVTVSDQNGCSKTASVTISSGQAPEINISQKNVSCFGGNDGELSVSGQSLSGSFSYRWSTGATGASVRNLAAGAYSVTVSHSSGCETVRQVQLTEPAQLRVNLSGQDALCAGTATGSVISVVSGGRSPYSYRWSNGAQTAGLQGVAAGTYSVTVTGALACTAVASFAVAQPSDIVLTSTVTDAQNGGGGSVVLGVSGGVGPYGYSWSNGASSRDLTNVAAGTYTVTVTDSKACQKTLSVTVNAIDPGPSICVQRGKSTRFEWIASVSLGTYTNDSGNDGGYGDYTAEQIPVEAGEMPIRLVPEFKANPYNEYWRVWIDWNEDEDFMDEGEQVFEGISSMPLTGAIVIPEGLTGTRRLRVALKYASYAAPCTEFAYGEVEDYTLFFGDDTPVVISYCNISGNSTHEWIQRVSIGGMSHESGNDGGYADHTAKVVTAIRGTALELELIPGHSANVFGEAWKIWVDWNRDGTFEEPTELAFVQAPAFGRVRGSIAIPADAPLGRTRLRIAMLWNKLPNACGNNPWGEAEDYSIEVSGGANLQPFGATWGLSANNTTATNDGHIYRVYPNPASSSLTIAWLPALQENSITLTVLDAQGRHLREYKGIDVAQGQLELDVSNLPAGLYQIRLNAGQRTDVQRFIITR
jgi:hypothetical protein